MQDPTGEYQRHQRKLRRSRTGTLADGIYHLVIGIIGGLVMLGLLGYLLWTRSILWYAYALDVFLLLFCGFQIWVGWTNIKASRRPVMPQEIIQAKQHHRQELQKAAHGQLPSDYSKGMRYLYLGMMIFFGVLTGLGWHAVVSGANSAEVMGSAIGSTVALIIALLGFLASFGGRAHQKASAEELKRILQAGEFSTGEETKGEEN